MYIFKIKKVISFIFIANILLFAEVDIQTNIYDAAEEMMRMDEKMNRAIAEHNQLSHAEDSEMRLTDQLIEDFEELENGYSLQQKIEDMNNTEIEVSIENRVLIISTTTLEKKFIKLEGTQSSEMIMSSSKVSLFIPEDADEDKMEKSYENGILKIFFPIKRKFKK